MIKNNNTPHRASDGRCNEYLNGDDNLSVCMELDSDIIYVATSWSSYNRRNMEVASDEEEDEDEMDLEPPSSKIPEF